MINHLELYTQTFYIYKLDSPIYRSADIGVTCLQAKIPQHYYNPIYDSTTPQSYLQPQSEDGNEKS